ncbi:MAG: hypothetical protein HY510_04785 [Acidobacteria bacterium]|nr:hypothetical protein [Acidobacteriota bacterium]
MKRTWLQFLYLLYCLESGIFLLLAPWSLLWSHSYFTHVPALREIMLSGYVRGGVSAVGLLMIGIGTVDFVAFCRALRES